MGKGVEGEEGLVVNLRLPMVVMRKLAPGDGGDEGKGEEGLVVNLRLPMVIMRKLAPGDGGDGGRGLGG